MMEKNEIVKVQDILKYFESSHLDRMFQLAEKLYKARCFGADVQNAEQALVKMQAGLEMGMAPIESMNSLYIVNGHIAPWGAAQARLLKRKGWEIEYFDKEDENGNPIECLVSVSKGAKIYSYNALAKEVNQKQAWKINPKNKLRWHALGQIIRFDLPDIIDAGMSYLAEELEEFPQEKATVKVVENGTETGIADIIIQNRRKTPDLDNATKIEHRPPTMEDVKPPEFEETNWNVKLQQRLQELGAKSKADALNLLNSYLHLATSTVVFSDEEAYRVLIDLNIAIEKKEEDDKAKTSVIKNPKYWTLINIKKMIENLKTKAEIMGIQNEIARLYDDGEITQSVATKAVEEITKKLETLTKKP